MGYRNPPPVHPDIAGEQFMMTEEVKKYLGRSGFKVWAKLLHNREYNGAFKSYVTNEGIANLTGYAVRTIEDVMKKLRTCGLVVDTRESFTTRQLNHNGQWQDFRVFRRRVYGDWREGQISFPPRIVDAIREIPTHGGARKGAGRKPSNLIKPVGETNSRPWVIYRREIEDILSKDNISLAAESSVSSRRRVIEVKKKKEPKLVPPYPSSTIFNLAKTPDPPHLPDEVDKPRDARRLARAYRDAVKSRYGRDNWWCFKGDIEKSRYFPMLTEAAALFREFGIAPASWAAWCMDFWKYYIDEEKGTKASKGKVPPPTLVFSKKFITERRGHFQRDGLNYLGGSVIFPVAWKDVSRRYAAMQWDFRVKQPKTTHDVAYIVEDHFPGGWVRYYRRVRDQAQLDRARVQRLLQRGEWIWT